VKELEFIKYISKRPLFKGIGDDCAVLPYRKNKYLLVTTDMIIEGVHFAKSDLPYRIGWKAVAVNISDIAAMGGVPKYALISAGIPRNKGLRYLKKITEGIEAAARKFSVKIIGGDTNLSAKTVVNAALIGEVEKQNLLRRSGAKPGDLIFVTGALGEGKKKHLSFIPRALEARRLAANFKINAMIDLSDGLAMDLTRLASASRAGARVYKSLIPLSETTLSLRGATKGSDEAISSGEDFELLFTASVKESRRIIKRMGEKLPVTLIGEIVPKKLGIKIVEESGRERILKPEGFAHI